MTESPAPIVIDGLEAHRIARRAAWIAAVAATLIGLLGLFFQGAALAVLALLVGVYLLVSGIMRISTAITSKDVPTSWRVLLGVFGGLLVVGGVLALNNPFGTLVALVFVVGFGWIIDGVGYAVAAFAVGRGAPRWALLLVGVLLAIAGVILLVVPIGALAAVQVLASVLLLVVGVVSLLALIVAGASTRRS